MAETKLNLNQVIDGFVKSTDITSIRKVTQAEYDAMEQAGTLDEHCWYLIYTPQEQPVEEEPPSEEQPVEE